MTDIVAFEGIDGVGKTEIARRVADVLHAPLQAFPDYSTPVGQIIRRMLNACPESIDPYIMQSLQTVNRMERIPMIMRSGCPVMVCERYTASGIVYGQEDGIPADWLYATQYVLPKASVNILLWQSPTVCHERVHANDHDAYGKRSLSRMASLANRYSQMWANGQGSWDVNSWHVIQCGDKGIFHIVDEAVRLIQLHFASARIRGVLGHA